MNFRKTFAAIIFAVMTNSVPSAHAYWWAIDHNFVEKSIIERVTDINPGAGGIFFSAHMAGYNDIIVFDDALYFRADDGVHGSELWRYDGAIAALVADINPNAGHATPRYFVEYQGDLYFEASRPQTGQELYRFDGNSVSLAADIVSGPASGTPWGMVVVNDIMYFRGEAINNGGRLWQYDGSAASIAANVISGLQVDRCCAVFGDEVIFTAEGDSQEGLEPWAFDGATLKSLGDLNRGPQSSETVFRRNNETAIYQNQLYFMADDGDHGRELWRYNGQRIEMVEDYRNGAAASGPGNFVIFNSDLYFYAKGPFSRMLHRYDGANISVAAPYPNGPHFLNAGAFQNRFYFSGARSAPNDNVELFSYDGALALLEKEINPTVERDGSPNSSWPSGFTPFKGYLYFFADDGVHGTELWRVKRKRTMEISAVAANIFDEFWEWPIEKDDAMRRNIVAATFLFDGGQRRLIQRRRTNIGNLLRNSNELRTEIDVADSSQSLAVLTVVFDAQTGEQLAAGTSIARSTSEGDAASLRKKATSFGEKLTLKQTLRMRAPRQQRRRPIAELAPDAELEIKTNRDRQ